MSVTAVVGAQWGDEAKGKIVDLLSQDAYLVARFNGGDNAGHTVVNPYGTFKLRLIPNGFYNPHTLCVIGPGVVVNLATLLEEIDTIQASGIDLAGRLWISPRCHVIMPYHPLMESIYETAKGSARTGTTGRGIGPVYADKVSYNGIRLADIFDEAVFTEKLRIQLAVKNPILQAFDLAPLDLHAVLQEKLAQFERLRAMVREPFGLLQEALKGGQKIILEGAQAALLDNDWGTYPFCTASNTLAGGAAAGLGLSPRWISRVIGVAKAYTTRVGAGPMPTELLDQNGETLRQHGGEYGTVTGRPRRCGWLDAALVRFTAQLNGMT
jgi:adenylosuccinate synthase